MFEYEDDTPRPARNEPLIKLYELLCALIGSLTPTTSASTLRDGTGERLNGYIDELVRLTHDDHLNDLRVKIQSGAGGKPFVMGEAYARQLGGLVKYLFKINDVIGYYCAGPPEVKFSKSTSSASPTINFKAEQQNHQSTIVTVEFTQTIITLTEKLTNLERDFPDETSKENRFAKKLKASLSTAKDTLGIISEVLKIAGEVGIDPHSALKHLALG